jgi:hypothetical protein
MTTAKASAIDAFLTLSPLTFELMLHEQLPFVTETYRLIHFEPKTVLLPKV